MESEDEDSLNNVLICEVCRKISKRISSTILDCQHTLCLSCLIIEGCVNNKLHCPICDKLSDFPYHFVDTIERELLVYSFLKNGEFQKELICPKHNERAVYYCKTHATLDLCSCCLNEDHPECITILIENYQHLRKTMYTMINTVNEKWKSVLKNLIIKERTILKEYADVRKTMNDSFNDLKSSINEAISNDQLNEDKAKNLEEIIKKHMFANIPEIKNISSSFSIDYSCLIKSLFKLSEFFDINSFIELMNHLNLSFRQLSENEGHMVKLELFSNNKYSSPSLLVRLKNNQNNSKDSILLEKHIISKKEYDNISTILGKNFKIELFCIKRNLTGNVSFSNILNSLDNSLDSLVDLAFINCNLNENQTKILGEYLRKLHHIETVNLSLNGQMKSGLIDVCEGLESSCNTLKSVNFAFCNLSEHQCEKIGCLLKVCCNIEQLDISRNEETGYGLLSVFEALKNSCGSLRDVNLSECSLNERHCRVLGELFDKCSKLQKINFENNIILGKGLVNICDGLSNSADSLINLNFNHIDLFSLQAKELGNMVGKCSNIQSISLSRNPDMLDGFVDICEGLKSSSNTLTELDFAGYKLKESDVGKVTCFLKLCKKIEKICIDWSMEITKPLNIYECLKNSVESLREVDLKFFISKGENYENLEKLLKNCKNLEKCRLDHFHSSYCKTNLNFYKSLSECTNSLKLIQLGFPLTETGCSNLASLIKNCSSLESIDFSFQHENAKSARNLWEALKNLNGTLKTLIFNQTENMERSPDFINFLKTCKLEKVSLPWHKSLRHGLSNSVSYLKEISFQGELDEECCKDIGDMLKNCRSIENINLGDILYTMNGLINIYRGLLKSSNALKIVSLTLINLNEAQCDKIIELWKNCSNFVKQNIYVYISYSPESTFEHRLIYCAPKVLRYLNFEDSEITEIQCRSIGNLVNHLTQIEYINLSENTMMGNGVINIINGLRSSAGTLKKINVANTKLNDNHGFALANLLQHCKIEFLEIGRNKKMSEGFAKIFNSLVNSAYSLKTLNVGNCNQKSSVVKDALATLLNACLNLHNICLDKFPFTDKEMVKICDGLKKSCLTLSNISLKFCDISERQAVCLSVIFAEFTTLKRLYLEGNDTMGRGMFTLCNSVCSLEHSLREIDLGSETMQKLEELFKRSKLR